MDGNLPMVTDQRSGQLSTGSTALADAEKARRRDVARALSPALALVGGATMNKAARQEWMAAADFALDGISPERMTELARRAMRVADHPSKIVPAMIAENEPSSGFKSAPNFGIPDQIAPDTRSDGERAYVAQGLGALAKKLSAKLLETVPDADRIEE